MKKYTNGLGTFLRNLKECMAAARKDCDTWYSIPKSRFKDPEYNRTAYRASSKPGFMSRALRFLGTLRHCISVAWEAADTFHHLPKSRYQDADHIRELMKLSPKPRGNLLHMPFTIGRGVVFSDTGGKGWNVRPHDEEPDEVFFVPDETSGVGDKPELEI